MRPSLLLLLACGEGEDSNPPADTATCEASLTVDEFREAYVDMWCGHWADCPGTTWARADCWDLLSEFYATRQDEWDICSFDSCLSDMPPALETRGCDESVIIDPDPCAAALSPQ